MSKDLAVKVVFVLFFSERWGFFFLAVYNIFQKEYEDLRWYH